MTNMISLKTLQTFGLPVYAKGLVTAQTPEELLSHWHNEKANNQPVLILGGGSNTLFTENFNGTIILNRIKGYRISEAEDAWHLHIGAGENWHDLVSYTIKHHMPGLENLALIPGCVGSAPIQNIGAYGIEFECCCEYVELIDLKNKKKFTLTDCQFGYRESIFKHQYREGFAIIAVGIRLPKKWLPQIKYGDLKSLDPQTVTPQEIFNLVCQTRRKKLPDPSITGNAGSFFKNPVVGKDKADEILQDNPQAPYYLQPNGTVKLAAGWLIDQCGLKGYQIGGAAVHKNQALVLINQDNATAQDIVKLAAYVRDSVMKKFGIALEPEIRFITAQGEKAAVALLDEYSK